MVNDDLQITIIAVVSTVIFIVGNSTLPGTREK